MHHFKLNLVFTLPVVFVLCLQVRPALSSPYTFQSLGDLPGGNFRSTARAISADGSTVVGSSSSAFEDGEAFRWTSDGGMVGLGDLPGGGFRSGASAVSPNGSVIVGGSESASGFEAFRWTSGGGMVGLGDLSGGSFQSGAGGVSADGMVVVGSSNSVAGQEAFRWTSGTGMVGLDASENRQFVTASDVSADGSIIVGGGSLRSRAVAILRTPEGELVGLGNFFGGVGGSSATAISDDGSVTVGYSPFTGGLAGFRWSDDGRGLVRLEDLPGGNFISIPRDVSADGSVIVGSGTSATGSEAMFWTADRGMRSVRDFLLTAGLTEPDDWTLSETTGVSADGRTIVGWGTNPNGDREAWIATVPEPSTLVLAAIGLAALVGIFWKRHSRQINDPRACDNFHRTKWRWSPTRRTRITLHHLICFGVSFLSIDSARASIFTFQSLGDLPGNQSNTQVNGISADGSVAVGIALSESGREAFRWSSVDGIVGLGDLPGENFSSEAYAVSADGSVIVGQGRSTGNEAALWTADGTIIGLGDFPRNGLASRAFGVSADGSVVVGQGTSIAGIEAFRWTNDGGMVALGDLAGGAYFNFAFGVSADGSVIVGRSESTMGSEAFRWTANGGMVGLGDLPGGDFESIATAVSADGSVVVGRGRSASGNEATRWTAADGLVGLGDLPGGVFSSVARATSADGSVVVGASNSASGAQAIYWTSERGMRSVRDMLIAGGVTELADWTLTDATGVSADGRTIVGQGRNPLGQPVAWIATVPEPSTLVLAAIGLAALAVGQGRSLQYRAGRRRPRGG